MLRLHSIEAIGYGIRLKVRDSEFPKERENQMTRYIFRFHTIRSEMVAERFRRASGIQSVVEGPNWVEFERIAETRAQAVAFVVKRLGLDEQLLDVKAKP